MLTDFPRVDTIQFALRRSKHRVSILRALAQLVSAFPAQLAAQGGVSLGYTLDALVGRHPAYRSQHSLVALGLARACMTSLGVCYEITDAGRAALEELDGSAEDAGLRAY